MMVQKSALRDDRMPVGVTLQLLTIPQVAQMLSMSRPTVYQMIYCHGLPVIRLGRSVRVSLASLQEWIAQRQHGDEEGGNEYGYEQKTSSEGRRNAIQAQRRTLAR